METAQNNRYLILEDGSVIPGISFGCEEEVICELVFNTSMVGYQEILSDPSYTGQAVVMTYPLIGNYGMNKDDYETNVPSMCGLIVRDYNDYPSNFRSEETLAMVMKKYHIAGITGVDTRKLTRHIRDYGSCKALITKTNELKQQLPFLLSKLKNEKLRTDFVSQVSTKKVYTLKPSGKSNYTVVAIDCGMKHNILRSLTKKGCTVYVVPWNITSKEIENLNPDGVFISNGPGDPTEVSCTIQTVKELIGKIPVFGICLGHQIISLAYGATTYKLKFGHRGGNHPVKNLQTGKVEMTSQNHSYAVNEHSLLNTGLKVTHINLLDQTIEGVCCDKDLCFSVQYHPESAPGPQDSAYLFDRFLSNMDCYKEGGLSCQKEQTSKEF